MITIPPASHFAAINLIIKYLMCSQTLKSDGKCDRIMGFIQIIIVIFIQTKLKIKKKK
jgi:hypothetical protein